MKQLSLENFKAFGRDIAVLGDVTDDGQPMNVLCYGENGAGKSTLIKPSNMFFIKHELKMREFRHI